MEFTREYFAKAGKRGGLRSAKRLGKQGLSARALKGWRTRKAKKNGK